MPKTSTKRSRTFQTKVKEDFELYNFYKSKDRERKRAEGASQRFRVQKKLPDKRS